MCVGALLRGHEQDMCLADVGFMPPRPNRWRHWVFVDSTVSGTFAAEDWLLRELLLLCLLEKEDDQIALAEEPLALEEQNQAPPVLNSFPQKEENHSTALVTLS